MAQNALIVKSRFQFKSAGLYGIAVLVFNMDHKILIEDYVYVSRFSELYNTDIKAPWYGLEIILNRIQMQGNYATAISGEFKRTLRERLDPNYGLAAGIVVDYELRNREKIHGSIEEILTFVQKDKNISVEIAYETADMEEMTKARAQRSADDVQLLKEADEAPAAVPVELTPGDFLIPASPMLSPINGRPSGELIPGINILMRMDMSHGQAYHWAQVFKAYNPETKEVLPLVATVTQVGPLVNKCRDIVVSYGQNRITRFNIEASIKVKVYDLFSKEKAAYPHLVESGPAESAAEENRQQSLFFHSVLLWAVFGIILLLSVLMIFYLVFGT